MPGQTRHVELTRRACVNLPIFVPLVDGEGPPHGVGECCMGNEKIPTHMQDLFMEMHSYERESVSTYPCRSLSGSVYNAVDVVVLFTIQSRSDLI